LKQIHFAELKNGDDNNGCATYACRLIDMYAALSCISKLKEKES